MNLIECTQHDSSLIHYGIKGMRWGIRRFQNPDGSLTEEGKKRYYKNGKSFINYKTGEYWKNPEAKADREKTFENRNFGLTEEGAKAFTKQYTKIRDKIEKDLSKNEDTEKAVLRNYAKQVWSASTENDAINRDISDFLYTDQENYKKVYEKLIADGTLPKKDLSLDKYPDNFWMAVENAYGAGKADDLMWDEVRDHSEKWLGEDVHERAKAEVKAREEAIKSITDYAKRIAGTLDFKYTSESFDNDPLPREHEFDMSNVVINDVLSSMTSIDKIYWTQFNPNDWAPHWGNDYVFKNASQKKKKKDLNKYV